MQRESRRRARSGDRAVGKAGAGAVERDSDEHNALVSIPGPGYNEVYGWTIDAAYALAAQREARARGRGWS